MLRLSSLCTISTVDVLLVDDKMQYITNTNFEFRTDQVDGSLISIHYRDIGWVEHFKKYGHIWIADTPTLKLHQTWVQDSINHIVQQYTQKSNVIGLIQHLAQIRLDQPFIMPLFVKVGSTDNLTISAGNCRRDAYVLNRTPAKEIPAILYSSSDTPPQGFGNVRKLETTKEFEDTFKLKDIDYRLSVAVTDNDYVVVSSVVRHTIFDRRSIESLHVQAAASCLAFWERFTNNNTNKI